MLELWRVRSQPHRLYLPPPTHVLHVQPARAYYRNVSNLLPGLGTASPRGDEPSYTIAQMD